MSCIVPDGVPVSTSVIIESAVHRDAIVSALRAVDSIHTCIALPTVPIGDADLEGDHGHFTCGKYQWQRMRIDIDLVTPFPGYAALHEIGHLLDFAAFQPPGIFNSATEAFDLWYDKTVRSDTVRELNRRRGLNTIAVPFMSGIPAPVDGRLLEQTTQRQELFAHAYAWFVGSRCREALIQAEMARMHTNWETWVHFPIWKNTNTDFRPIARELERMLRLERWI